MAPHHDVETCRGFNNFYELDSLNVSVGGYIVNKNTHGINNIKSNKYISIIPVHLTCNKPGVVKKKSV